MLSGLSCWLPSQKDHEHLNENSPEMNHIAIARAGVYLESKYPEIMREMERLWYSNEKYQCIGLPEFFMFFNTRQELSPAARLIYETEWQVKLCHQIYCCNDTSEKATQCPDENNEFIPDDIEIPETLDIDSGMYNPLDSLFL